MSVNLRQTETRLANFTLAALAIFAPLETWVSWQWGGGLAGLVHPLYLIDLIGMVLMLWGGLHSRRARPRPAPGLLCAAHAWMAANGWRASYSRIDALSGGGQLYYGAPELWVVAGMTALTLACLALSLFLTARAEASH